MKVLILGGTRFFGRHIAEAALARGHEVTLFNRGQSDPNPDIAVEQLRGDRGGKLTALRGRRWDAVIDTSGYVPRIVRASAELLAPAVGHYTFISTASVYAYVEPGRPIDEGAALETLADETREDYESQAYGGLKVLCEWVSDAFLLEQGVTRWTELPLWVPWARSWLAMLDSTKALAAGLRLRPPEETVRDVLVGDATRPQGGNRRAGLTPDREAALLRRWQALQQTSS